MKIGFIGLGIMGRPMAQRLLEAGFDLTAYSRTKSRMAALVAGGARAAASSGEVAAASDVIISMVPDTDDLREVLFGDQGVCSGLAPGKIVIDMSTISPMATVEFAQRLQQRSCEMLDAPVSGGEQGAAAGTLSIMVGGSREAYEKCLPVFNVLGKTVMYTGSHGNGQKTKLVNQVVGALNLLAVAEGLLLANAAKLDQQTTLQVLAGGAASSWMLTNLGPKMAQGDYSPGFRIRLQQKDLRLAREWLAELGLSLPGTELTASLYTKALKMGLGEQGNQGLYGLLEKGAGC